VLLSELKERRIYRAQPVREWTLRNRTEANGVIPSRSGPRCQQACRTCMGTDLRR